MSGNRIEIDIAVLDTGNTTRNRIKEAERLRQTLSEAQALGTGTRSGNQAARMAGFQEYTIAGGVTGRSGAAARDFANQAQGLDGLVRLYAEYAARLFAASAAFTALRNAMDTDIMVRGMEQLSAASGTSLASMTKSFITATDGMISFREAAEAVTKATSSGLGREQVMQIAEVAKGASQALGVNMNDAVSRLTRGITKLEPELLDELGIFTKLDKAVTDYARTVGKSESALTDFERRQAFANAVLKEGRDKFSEIAQEGNPYDKLLASLKDVAQKMLSVVNSVITPIVKLFADNSALIAGAITIIATKIISKAIPALNAYGESLKNSAKESAKIAAMESNDASFGRYLALRKSMKIDEQLAPGQQNLVNLTNQKALLQDQIDKLKSIGGQYERIVGLQNKQQLLTIEINREKQKQTAIQDTLQRKMDVPASIFKEPWEYMKEKIADTRRQKAAGMDIKAQVVEVAQISGPIEAFSKLNELLKINTTNMGLLGKAGTYLASTISILGQTVLTTVGYLADFLKYIGVIITIIELYDTYFSSNSKQTELFNTKLSELNNTVKTAMDVNTKYAQTINVDSVLAYSNAINEVATSLKSVTDQYREATLSANRLDKLFNDFKKARPLSFLIPSREEELAKTTGVAVATLIQSLGNRPETKEYKQNIAEILGLKDTEIDAKNVRAALTELRRDEDKFIDIQTKISQETEKVNKKLQDQTLYLRGLKDSAQNAEKSATTFMNSLRDTSNISTMMENTLKYLTQLDKAMRSTDQKAKFAAIDSLKDVNFGALFGDAAVEIARLSSEFEEIQGPANAASIELEKVQKRIDKLSDSWFLFGSESSELAGLKLLKVELEKLIDSAKTKAADLANLVSQAVSKSVDAQIEQTVKKYNLEVQKLGVEQAKFMASKAPVKTVGMIDYQAKLDKELVNIESQLLSAQYDLADSIDRLNSTIKQESDIRRKDLLEKAGVTVDGTDKRSVELQGINKRLEATLGPGGEMMGTSYQRADKFLEDFKSGKLKLSPQKLIEEAQVYLREFPEKLAQFDRILKNQLRKTAAANKVQQIDITATIDKINLTTQQAVEQIDNEIQSINVAISNIGSDTPARIQLAMDAANLILTKELDKIDLITKAKLDNLSKIKLPADKVKEQKDRIATEDKMARFKVEQAAKEKELENAAQKTLLVEKQKQDIIIKTAEAQKGLVIGEGLMFDLQRQNLDRLIRQAQDSIEIAELQKKLTVSEKKLQNFESKTAAEGMTAAQLVEGGNLIAAVQEDKDALQRARALQGVRNKGAEAQNNYNNLLTQQKTVMAEFDASQERQAALDSKNIADRTVIVNKAEQQLNIQQKLGFLTDREIQVGQAAIAQARLEVERDTELLNLARERLRIEQLIALESEKPQQFVDTEMGDRVPVKSDTQIQLESQLKGVSERVDATKIKAREGIESIQRDLDITPRMEKYSNAFNGYFNSMADAIENWARTGKYNSKELFQSLIQDLARYELRLAMTALYANAIRPLFNSALSFLGFGFQLPVGKAKGDIMMGGASLPGYAMGGAFNQGRELNYYAMGGIVDKPVLFPMKKGMGLMGEAGPEAIMPLRKDANGNLGVMTFANGGILPVGRMPTGEMGVNLSSNRSSSNSRPQYNHETIIHNYTGQPVQERSSVDSRGTRRTEYFIGEVAAGETARTGGTMQTAIRNTYGLQPKLIRR
ncbi:hypothetical protein EB118_07195 [bacterium]|nr:hypothetical protein [bacterium]